MIPKVGASGGAGYSHTTPLLELSDVAHRFGRRWVLRGATLAVSKREVVAIGGGNGAGKTTLLRIASTLLRPSRGHVRVRGSDASRDADEIRGEIGYLGHSPGLYEDLTARENLAFAIRMRGEPPDPAALKAILAEVGLSGHADTTVRRFSAGMRRRLALGRILSFTPALLLMDEPYASLDSEGVDLVNRTILRVAGEGGAIVIATHDFIAGESVTTRVVTLRDGQLDASWTAAEVAR